MPKTKQQEQDLLNATKLIREAAKIVHAESSSPISITEAIRSIAGDRASEASFPKKSDRFFALEMIAKSQVRGFNPQEQREFPTLKLAFTKEVAAFIIRVFAGNDNLAGIVDESFVTEQITKQPLEQGLNKDLTAAHEKHMTNQVVTKTAIGISVQQVAGASQGRVAGSEV